MKKVRIRGTREQTQFINDSSPFPAFVGGFGSGKTEALILRCIKGKLEYPSLNRAYYLPTYDLVKQIGFPRFEEKLSALGIKYKLNQSDKYITVFHRGQQGRIIFRTLDKPERIIGYQVADSDVDELDTLPAAKAEDAWNKIIARNRQKKPDGKPNTVGVGTTPEGFRFVYKKWEKEKTESYSITRAATKSNARNLPADYIEKLEETYPKQLLAAYLEGKFVNLASGAVYSVFDRLLNHTDEEEDGLEPLYIGMDFNIYNMSAVVHVLRSGLPCAVEEIGKRKDTPDMIQAIKEIYPNRDITIYPDASGRSAKSVNASVSDISLLIAAGFKVKARSQNPPVRDRIVSVCSMILNAKGDRRWKINTKKCPDTTLSLEQQVYKNGEPDKTQGMDHKPDALGYYLHYEFPAIGKPTLRIR